MDSIHCELMQCWPDSADLFSHAEAASVEERSAGQLAVAEKMITAQFADCLRRPPHCHPERQQGVWLDLRPEQRALL